MNLIVATGIDYRNISEQMAMLLMEIQQLQDYIKHCLRFLSICIRWILYYGIFNYICIYISTYKLSNGSINPHR